MWTRPRICSVNPLGMWQRGCPRLRGVPPRPLGPPKMPHSTQPAARPPALAHIWQTMTRPNACPSQVTWRRVRCGAEGQGVGQGWGWSPEVVVVGPRGRAGQGRGSASELELPQGWVASGVVSTRIFLLEWLRAQVPEIGRLPN